MRWSLGVVVGLGGLLALGSTAHGASDAYLRFGGVNGETAPAGERGGIAVKDWSFGKGRGIGSPTGGGATDRESSAPKVSEITITKDVDRASPSLRQCVSTGCRYPTAELTVRKAGGGQQEYVRYTLTDVTISSYRMSGGDRPSESITLNFAKIEMNYEPQQKSGTGAPAAASHVMAPSSRLPPPGPGH